jgi:RNA polymerase sigma-70 factor (ECF subfamily)
MTIGNLQNVWRSEAGTGILVHGRREAGASGFRSGLGRFWLKGVTDEVLIAQVARGEERAVSELYDRYGGIVYGVGMRSLGDRTLAEDLVQDVFVSVWRNAKSFDPSRASFATWVYRMTRNRVTDLARRRSTRIRVVAPSIDEEAFPEPGEGDDTEEVLRAFEVVGALSELSPAHREVLVLAYFGGLSQREISTRIDTPLGTVKSRTTAALRAARKYLLDERREDDPKARGPRDG